jgi:Tol biopolymer transport system component
MSRDGEFIAFSSAATNLVPGVADTNSLNEALLYQRSSGKVSMLSRTGGISGPAATGELPVISTGGRYAAFISPVRTRNVVLLDRVSGKVFQVGTTHGPPGSAPGLSDDGRYVLFSSALANVVPGQDDHNGEPDLFVFDRVTGERRLVSHVAGSPLRTGERGAFDGRLSADGRRVVFVSLAADLLPGLPGFVGNVFLYDLPSQDVALVSRSVLSPERAAHGYSLEPVVSANGGFVAFTSFAADLVPRDFNGGNPDVFLYVPVEE